MGDKCGTYAGYQQHKADQTVRCQPCRDASAHYERWRTYDQLLGRARFVPAVGSLRRIRALMALGWPHRYLAQRLGVLENNLSRLPRQKHVRATFHAHVIELYNELGMLPGPSSKTRTWAARSGAVPPLAWNEDDIDNPDALPSGLPASLKGIQGRPGAAIVWDALRWEDVDRLRECGVGDEQIAERFGISEKALLKAELRWGRVAA